MECQISGNDEQIMMKFRMKSFSELVHSGRHIGVTGLFKFGENFLDNFRNIAVVKFLVTLICANSFVKIYDLMLLIHELTKTRCFFTLENMNI